MTLFSMEKEVESATKRYSNRMKYSTTTAKNKFLAGGGITATASKVFFDCYRH